MSVLDDLAKLEDNIKARARELRQAAAEYEELKAVAERLGIDIDDDDAPKRTTSEATTKRRASTRRKPASGGRGRGRARAKNGASTGRDTASAAGQTGSANGANGASADRNGATSTTAKAKAKGTQRRRRASGSRAQELAQLVQRMPGITVPDAGKELGMKDYTPLYRHVRKLESEGVITKQGRELRPAG